MKNLTRDIKSKFTQDIYGYAKHFIKIFSSLFNIPSYELIKNVWEKLCMLLFSPTVTPTVEKTVNFLVLTVTVEFKYEENVAQTKSFYESKNHKTIYEFIHSALKLTVLQKC